MASSIELSNINVSNQLLSMIKRTNKNIDLSIADLNSTEPSSFGEMYQNTLSQNVLNSNSNLDSDFGTSSSLSSSDSFMQGFNVLGGLQLRGMSNHASSGMQASNNAINFIIQHEGFLPTAYRGIDYQNQTIGYGHVIQPDEQIDTLTQQQGQNLLKTDLTQFEDSVNKEFAGVNLSQNQFDSLVSFSYNTGANIWDKVPQLTSDIKSGASADVLKQDFAACSNCNGEFVQGLYNRRMDEWQLYTGLSNV
jgi:lysozyme